MKHYALIIYIFILFFCAGCLDFGENIEYSGSGIETKHIRSIQNFTGLTIPSDSINIKYYYHGNTIDPFWHYKAILSKTGYNKILQSKAYSEYKLVTKLHKPFIEQVVSWWHADKMRNASFTEKNSSTLVSCSIGKENEKYVLYLSGYTF